MLREGNTDLITFLISAIAGVALCLLYDAFRILRIAKRPTTVSGFVQDVLYFFIAAIITFLMLLVRCSGEIRWFVLAGELTGAVLCRFTVSRAVMAVSGAVIHFIKSVIRFIIKTVIEPLKRFLGWIKNIVLKLAEFLFKIFLHFLKKFLKPPCKLVYNIPKKLFRDKKRADEIT